MNSRLAVSAPSFLRDSARLVAAAVALAVLGGCSTHSGVSLRVPGNPLRPVKSGDPVLPKPAISLLISPLDQVRVQVLPQPVTPGGLLIEPHDTLAYAFVLRGSDYHLLPGDELAVRFSRDDRTARSMVIGPDGHLGVEDLGDLPAAGHTAAELAKQITELVKSRYNDASAVVEVVRSNRQSVERTGEAIVQRDGTLAIPRLGRIPAAGLAQDRVANDLARLAKETFFGNDFSVHLERVKPTTQTEHGLMGFDQMLTVSQAGDLVLPEVGPIPVAGRSTAEAQASLTAAVRTLYFNPVAVTVAVEHSASRVVYIDGEVTRPGAYPLAPDLTIARLVALAGGSTESAQLKEVVLIHREGTGAAVFVTNLREFLDDGVVLNDLALSPQDIVVVPKSGIAKADLWVAHYITGLLPFSRVVSYSYNRNTATITPAAGTTTP